MALLWWFGDRVRLVRNLAPPMAGPAAERALERIYQAYGRQLYRERHGREPARQARRELAALHKALSGLSPRAVNALQAAVAQEPRVQAARLLNMRVALHLMRLATERAMTDMPLCPYERPPDVGVATLHAIHLLCVLYCRAHGVPYPTWNFGLDRPYNRRPIAFAFRCLRAWHAPGARDFPSSRRAPGGKYANVIRALHKYRCRFQP
jgi:hypothetical protein